MRNISKILLTAALILFTYGSTSFSADIAKIGVVDFQRVFTESSPGKLAKAEINKQGKQMEDSLKKMGEEIEELRKKREREALVMSQEKDEEKQREIRIKINDFKTAQQNFTRQLKELELRLGNKFKNELIELSNIIGKKEGYLLILEKNEAGILYYPESIDITDQLIKEYNKTAAAN